MLTHAAPEEPAPGAARYVTDGIASCVAQAKAAAGGRDILLHGAATAQACLRAGLLDEMELQLMPVLLGQGRRLFEDLPPDHIELELLRSLDGPGVLHLRYRVRSAGVNGRRRRHPPAPEEVSSRHDLSERTHGQLLCR